MYLKSIGTITYYYYSYIAKQSFLIRLLDENNVMLNGPAPTQLDIFSTVRNVLHSSFKKLLS